MQLVGDMLRRSPQLRAEVRHRAWKNTRTAAVRRNSSVAKSPHPSELKTARIKVILAANLRASYPLVLQCRHDTASERAVAELLREFVAALRGWKPTRRSRAAPDRAGRAFTAGNGPRLVAPVSD